MDWPPAKLALLERGGLCRHRRAKRKVRSTCAAGKGGSSQHIGQAEEDRGVGSCRRRVFQVECEIHDGAVEQLGACISNWENALSDTSTERLSDALRRATGPPPWYVRASTPGKDEVPLGACGGWVRSMAAAR